MCILTLWPTSKNLYAPEIITYDYTNILNYAIAFIIIHYSRCTNLIYIYIWVQCDVYVILYFKLYTIRISSWHDSANTNLKFSLNM
jgi:hypothetical protein